MNRRPHGPIVSRVTIGIAGGPLERRVAKLRTNAQAAQLHLMQRILKGKLKGRSLSAWKAALAQWDTRTDFAPALLHAERLTQMLADAAAMSLETGLPVRP